ncbi:unnamed protein product [Citrullus colocynthis]|uniref:Uncharacterized protein n=1 Tax=Citrullus colocynthis TaxID=252529 RepID=A0ABP0YF85_9ROSI
MRLVVYEMEVSPTHSLSKRLQKGKSGVLDHIPSKGRAEEYLRMPQLNVAPKTVFSPAIQSPLTSISDTTPSIPTSPNQTLLTISTKTNIIPLPPISFFISSFPWLPHFLHPSTHSSSDKVGINLEI